MDDRIDEDSLRAAQREADKARAAKTRFMMTASNDIRHHLQTLVLTNATLIKIVPDETAHRALAMQGEALSHLTDLMNSMLDLTEIDSGDVDLNIDDVNLGEILAELDEEFRSNAQVKQLDLEIGPSSEVVRTDRKLLRKALRSLLANAIRYTETGKVSVRCDRETSGLRVSVRDTGIGIADDDLADIFDEFYRVEHDPASRDMGLGLGLTLVDRITRLLDITLKVESQVGKGSTFSLLLPHPATEIS